MSLPRPTRVLHLEAVSLDAGALAFVVTPRFGCKKNLGLELRRTVFLSHSSLAGREPHSGVTPSLQGTHAPATEAAEEGVPTHHCQPEASPGLPCLTRCRTGVSPRVTNCHCFQLQARPLLKALGQQRLPIFHPRHKGQGASLGLTWEDHFRALDSHYIVLELRWFQGRRY